MHHQAFLMCKVIHSHHIILHHHSFCSCISDMTSYQSISLFSAKLLLNHGMKCAYVLREDCRGKIKDCNDVISCGFLIHKHISKYVRFTIDDDLNWNWFNV